MPSIPTYIGLDDIAFCLYDDIGQLIILVFEAQSRSFIAACNLPVYA
ncbi:MAG: hypothetical protein ACHQUC_08235 [Chlamydiales bacterium]